MEQDKRIDLSAFSEKINLLHQSIAKVIVGQQTAIDMLLTCIIADGHVLIEGVPGVAKTLLAKLTARLIDARYSRIQFTPDLMPSDVLGTTVLDMKTQEFSFHEGPAFADIVLADEINRSPAKTQAALFEVMEERQATIDGVRHPMGPVYTVIATQNPVEQEGTYRLPEAQLDRFMMKIGMGYPTESEEMEILRRHNTLTGGNPLDGVKPVLTKQELLALRSLLPQVVVDESLMRYIVQIVEATRTSRAVLLGGSPRASLAMLSCAKAYALLSGRDFITPEDIQTVSVYVLQHRLVLTAEAEMEGYTAAKVVEQLVGKIEVPK